MTRHLIPCACDDVEHFIDLTVDEDPWWMNADDPHFKDVGLYVTVHAAGRLRDRLKAAWNVLRGKRAEYQWALLDWEGRQKLREVLEKVDEQDE